MGLSRTRIEGHRCTPSNELPYVDARYQKAVQPLFLAACTSLLFSLATPVSATTDNQNDVIQAQNQTIEKQNDIIEEQNERLEQLETAIIDIEERIGTRAVAQAFDALNLNVGGFFHTIYSAIDGENGNVSGFTIQNFELIISTQINEQWSGFVASGFLRESDDPFTVGSADSPSINHNAKAPQIISWVNYQSRDALNIRIGRLINPQGIINIIHFPAQLLEPSQPMFLRPFSGDTIFPNFVTAVELHGKGFFANGSGWKYHLLAGNFSGKPDEAVTAARASYLTAQGAEFGINVNTGVHPDDTASGRTNRHYGTFGLDYQKNFKQYGIKAELFQSTEDDFDTLAGYIQPHWRFAPKWTSFIRYDLLEVPDLTTVDTVSDIKEITLGIVFDPSRSTRLRAVYVNKDFDALNVNADFLQLSATVTF